jgi:hypothetical protein
VSDSLVFLPCAPSPSPRSLRFGGQLLAVCGLSRVYEYNTVSSLWLACDALRILMHSALRRDGGGFLLPRFRFLAAAAAAGCMRCCARSALSCLESHSLHRSLPQCCSVPASAAVSTSPSISLKAAVSHQLQHAACRLAMQWACWFEWSQCPVSCVPLLRVFRSTFFQFFQGTVGERMKMRCNPSDEGLTINHPTVNKDFIIKVIKCHV